MEFKELLFGTAGIPVTTNAPNTENGIKRVQELGLGGMELEFVRNVGISAEKAPEIKKIAEKENVLLTCHGSYFINLNAIERDKIEDSKKRLLHAARIANACGAYSVCFHAGFYLKMDEEEVFDKIKKELKEVVQKLKNEGNDIWIRPETTGKKSQFGTLEEILRLSKEIEQVMPCIDFSHLHARSNGKLNSFEEFSDILEKVEKILGKEGLHNLHCHVSGIAYGEKGEKHHLNLKNSDLKYEELCKAWKEFNCKGIIISESPNIEGDALLLQETYKKIKSK